MSHVVCLGQKGSLFPAIEGEDLRGRHVILPQRNGKYSVVGIAYSRSAEAQLKQWLSPIYNLFIIKEEDDGGFDIAKLYDVNFMFVPMISGFKKVANDFKRGTDKAFWPYIMDAGSADITNVQNALQAKDTGIPYFYVLDKDGHVVAFESGTFSDEKLDRLSDAIE